MAIQRDTITSRVVIELRRRILRGDLAGGAPLRQESLAADFGVSRIPLREAIRQLEAEGLVVSFPHRGVCVAALSRSEFEELCELRQQLEPWLFRLAIPRMTTADFAAAEQLIERAEREGAPANWGELNWLFHQALYLPAGRGIALRLLQTVHHRAERYINLLLVIGRDLHGELAEHVELAACARAGDIDGGCVVLERHIARVTATVLDAIASRGTPELELAG